MTLPCENCSHCTLYDWTRCVTLGDKEAEALYSVIDGHGYHLHEQQMFDAFNWKQIAYLSGIDPTWPGYKEDKICNTEATP